MGKLAEREFVDQYSDAHARLWTLATAILNDRTAAEDVVQEAAIVALKKLDQFDSETSFTAWMSQIVRFCALNFLKKRQNRKMKSLEVHTELDRGSEPKSNEIVGGRDPVDLSGQLFSNQEAFDDDMNRALASIDSDRRMCLLLRVVHELAYDEIAEITGIPEGTAMSHVHRAKAALRTSMNSEFKSTSPHTPTNGRKGDRHE